MVRETEVVFQKQNFSLDNEKTIICIADTVECADFLETTYKHDVNVFVVIKPKWKSTTNLRLASGYCIIDDLLNAKLVCRSLARLFELVGNSQFSETKIDYVLAFSEKYVEVSSIIEDMFGLKKNTKECLSLFRDKYLMRARANSGGICGPRFALASDDAEVTKLLDNVAQDSRHTNAKYRYIAKPRALWASEGVRQFRSSREVSSFLKTKTRGELEQFLVEEYFDGELYHVDGIVTDGVVRCKYVFRYGRPLITPEKTNHNCHATDLLLAKDDRTTIRLKEIHDQVVSSFGLIYGLTHIEIFHDKETNTFGLCEAAARPPGMGIIRLHEIASGRRSLALFADLLFSSSPVQIPVATEYAGIVVFVPERGKLKYVDSLDRFEYPEIVDRQQSVRIGTFFDSASYLNELGRIYIKAGSEEIAANVLRELVADFNFELERA